MLQYKRHTICVFLQQIICFAHAYLRTNAFGCEDNSSTTDAHHYQIRNWKFQLESYRIQCTKWSFFSFYASYSERKQKYHFTFWLLTETVSKFGDNDVDDNDDDVNCVVATVRQLVVISCGILRYDLICIFQATYFFFSLFLEFSRKILLLTVFISIVAMSIYITTPSLFF